MSTQERIKKRREYLMTTGKAYTEFSIASFCLISCIVFDAALVGGLAYHLHKYFSVTDNISPELVAFVICGTGLTVLFGWMTWTMACAVRRAHQQAKQPRYVPPVTPDSLPAEKVLVRGSEEPTQEQGKVLLRGTDGSAGTGEQDLLRGSQKES